jgi:hypothetical protein
MAKIVIVQLRLKGDAPLLMHNDRGVNPFDPLVKQIAVLNSKKTNKTDDDKHLVERLEWEVGLYYNEAVGPYIPGENLKKAIWEAAKAFRGGAAVIRGVTPLDVEIPLVYRGPRDIEGMWKAGFVDIRSTRLNGKTRIMRTRPRFDEWGLEASMQVLTSVLDLDTFKRYATFAGRITGLGDYRPRFGRFTTEIEILEEIEVAEGTDEESDE